jgi:FkbH-like protein
MDSAAEQTIRGDPASEPVRLVIWDLDDTYWRGTLSEGGIQQYLQQNHDTVIELAKRGIVSSICSKNDEAAAIEVLQRHNILDYFVFPSISWGSKGHRIASIIEAMQLRPASVMFMDDNPNSRAEALASVGDLQVEDERFAARLLQDPRFKGNSDEGLTRLSQYKLLEKRKEDARGAPGSNEDFLRRCNIRVFIEYDVLSHIDRAIELINRTNQLNFTKLRLPEDRESAARELREAVNDHFGQCGLVRVLDNYGDYGFVGFFMLMNGALEVSSGKLGQWLVHYCFSCRTLGMKVEKWLYDRLQRPRIDADGEAAFTDLFDPHPVDWITHVQRPDRADAPPIRAIAPEIRLHGGCEAHSVAHYLAARTNNVVVTGNFHAGTSFVLFNSASLLLSACERFGTEFEAEAARLGLPYQMMVNHYFDDAPRGTAFVFGGQLDFTGSRRFRHKDRGWEVFVAPHGLETQDWMTMSETDLDAAVAALPFTQEVKSGVMATARHMRDNYEVVPFNTERDLPKLYGRIVDCLPEGSRIVFMLDHKRVRVDDHNVIDASWTSVYREVLRRWVESCPYAAVCSFEDHIHDEREIRIGGNHYDRMVYLRMAQDIAATIATLPAKGDGLVVTDARRFVGAVMHAVIR